MKNKLFSIAAILTLFAFFCSAQPYAPVNKNATPEAKQLLSFLYSVRGKYTITGQHNFVSDFPKYDETVHAMTGTYSALWGADFSFSAQGDNARKFQHCGPLNLSVPMDSCYDNGKTVAEQRQLLVNEAIKQHAKGRIITLMWHSCYPTNGDECNGDDIWRLSAGIERPNAAEWKELTTDGTPLNKAWKKQWDGVAFYLKQLQDAKVPVLWRPYHEMNGEWFWWGYQPGENGFKKLWIMAYNYLTNHHKLNNLLWVWNTNAPRDIVGDVAGPYADYFPGVDYVDVLTADVYRNDWRQSHHDQLMELGKGKLIGLGEVGNVPEPALYETQPNWSWFMVWGYCIYDFRSRDRNVNPAAKAIYDNPKSITADKIELSNNAYQLK